MYLPDWSDVWGWAPKGLLHINGHCLHLYMEKEWAATLKISSTSHVQKDDHSHAGWLKQCKPLRKWLCKWPGQQPGWSPVYIFTTTESRHTYPVHSSSFSQPYFQPSQWLLDGKPQSSIYVQQQNAKNVSEWILYLIRVMGLDLPKQTPDYPAIFMPMSCQCSHFIVIIPITHVTLIIVEVAHFIRLLELICEWEPPHCGSKLWDLQDI